MKIDLDTSNLNWNKATINDYRYIHHLMMMAYERWTKLGAFTNGSNYSNFLPFKLNRYSPFGILTWDQLSSIYHAMTYLGTYVYLNEKNLNEKYWKNGDNRKWIFYSLQDMCDIAEFDFFAHPFIPGQPLEYYSQFLLPIKKVLASYKKIATSRFITKYTSAISFSESGKHGAFPIPTYTYTDEYGVSRSPTIDGYELINYLADKDNWLKYAKRYYNQLKNEEAFTNFDGEKVGVGTSSPYLGYQYTVTTLYSLYTNRDGNDGNNRMDHGLVYSSLLVSFGNLFKSITKFIPGTSYKIYLLHTSKNSTYPTYLNSPWSNLIEVRNGVVKENGEIVEYIELPEIDVPMTLANSEVGKYYSEKKVLNENGFANVTDRKTKAAKNERFSAFYKPLIVLDYSSYFNYN